MSKIKKIKFKQADGTLSDYIAIGADAANIDLQEGITLEQLNSKIVRYESSQLKDYQGNSINPKTITDAIVNNEGEQLTSILNTLQIQYAVMPIPSAEWEDKIVQYIGEDTDSPDYYKQGYFYRCAFGFVYDSETETGSDEYFWIQQQVQYVPDYSFDEEPTADSYNLVFSGGIKTYVDNAIGGVSVDLSDYYNKGEIDAMIGDIETLLASL